MKYKHIEAAREVRLWIAQIIMPAVAGVMMLSPEARQTVAQAFNDVKHAFKRRRK